MTIEPAKSEVWNIKYDFDYDPDDAGDNFMPHLLFLVHFLGQTLLLTGFFLLSMPFRRKLSVLSTYSHIFLCPSCIAYSHQKFMLSSFSSACRRRSLMFIKPANRPKCSKFSWRYIA